MAKMEWLDWVLFLLVFIGALNWGLIGLFNFNLVVEIFGAGLFTTILYSAVGIAAVIYLIMKLKIFK